VLALYCPPVVAMGLILIAVYYLWDWSSSHGSTTSRSEDAVMLVVEGYQKVKGDKEGEGPSMTTATTTAGSSSTTTTITTSAAAGMTAEPAGATRGTAPSDHRETE